MRTPISVSELAYIIDGYWHRFCRWFRATRK